jgi:hypothetical protein
MLKNDHSPYIFAKILATPRRVSSRQICSDNYGETAKLAIRNHKILKGSLWNTSESIILAKSRIGDLARQATIVAQLEVEKKNILDLDFIE